MNLIKTFLLITVIVSSSCFAKKDSCYGLATSSRIETEDGSNLYFSGDFLYWKSYQSGLYYAVTGRGSSTQEMLGNEYDFDGDLQKFNPHWDPGFRIGVGYNMDHDDWNLFCYWTRFHTSKSASAQGDIITLWAHSNLSHGGYQSDSAKAKWRMHLDTADSELGRFFYVGERFSTRPFVGIKGAWINQNIDVDAHYIYGPEPGHAIPALNTVTDAKSEFKGGGILGGLDVRYAFPAGWSFLAKGIASLLYGSFNCDFNYLENDVVIANGIDNFKMGISHFALSLGLDWDTYFSDRYHLGMHIGWEQNIYFGVNHLNHYMFRYREGLLRQENEDLTLNGLTLNVRFDF
jgi:hypothetical protein